jgi:short-subunit dehydrogenase
LADELQEQHGIEVRVIASDLADPGTPAALCDELEAAGVTIDVLVNNAGFGAVGPLARLDLKRQLDMVQVNVVALLELTRRLLPGMIERGRGGVLNVGSTAAFQPGPYMATYFATKAFVLSLSEALTEEVAGRGVKVTCLAPGATETEFASVAHAEGTRLFRSGTMDAATVARAGYRAFRAGKALVVPGAKNWLGAAAVRFTPRSVVRKIAAALNRKKG